MSSSACEYDISWMDHTFRSRKNSELLLGPELANGNLSPRDYEALMSRLPGLHYSELAGFGASAAAVLMYSRFKQPKFSVGLIGYLGGLVLGRGLRMYTHQAYFRSIENLNGFSRAMDNVKRKVGYTPGPFRFRRPLSSVEMELPFQQEFDTPYGESLESSPAVVRTATSSAPDSQAPPVKSRWEEIRAARRAEGPGKAWENIRRGRKPDGTPLAKRTAPESERRRSPEDESWTTPTFRDSDRAAEQASFDAMLEKERKNSS